MNLVYKTITSIVVASVTLVGSVQSAQADVEPWANISLSNANPSVGDPVAVYVDLTNCATAPTSFEVRLFQNGVMEPFARLTKSTTGFTMRKIGTTYSLKWIYRGPTGDGVTSQRVWSLFVGTGGCAPSDGGFEAVASWGIASAGEVPSNVWSIYTQPQEGAIQMSWFAPIEGLDPSLYYEVQYSIFGLNSWSRSFATRDTSYVILGLTYQTIYDVRVRAVNRFGAGAWTQDTNQNYRRTPALFKTWITDGNGVETTKLSSTSTSVMHARLSNCSYEPPIANTGGTMHWYLWPVTTADGGTNLGGEFETSAGAATSYDSASHTYEASFTMPDLPAGDYRAVVYFYSMGCTWTFTPNALDGSKVSNTLEFSVGDHVVRKPIWGSRMQQGDFVTVTRVSPTSATLSWNAPLNIEDGPFTYSINLITGNGDTFKTLGTTSATSFTLTNLQQFTPYSIVVRASNSATATVDSQPYMYIDFQTSRYTAKRGTKLGASVLASATGVTIPTGATVTLTKPSSALLFTNCTFKGNIVTLANQVGACTVQMTIKPKKIGRVQPATIVKILDVMIKK